MNKTKKRNHQRLESDAANSCSWEGVSFGNTLYSTLLISFKAAKNLLKSRVTSHYFSAVFLLWESDVILTLLRTSDLLLDTEDSFKVITENGERERI